MSKENTIEPKRFYTLYEIVQEGLIPGVDSTQKAARIVRTDMLYTKVLKAQMVPRGDKGVQYKIRGENIIRYLTTLDDEKR